MAILRRNDDSSECDVQMTSFMDLVFLLLIFFIVTASLKRPEKVLPVHPPRASYAREARLNNETIITVTQGGDWYVYDGKSHFNQRVVDRAEMMTLLRGIAEKNKDAPIRVDVDKDAKYFNVMMIIDNLAFYDIRNVYLRSQHGSGNEKTAN